MNMLVPIPDINMPKPEWVNSMGTFNSFPLPAIEVDERSFQSVFSTYSPEYLEYRQIHVVENDKNQVLDTHIFWFHDTAIAMIHPSGKNPTRYFRIGCHHQWIAATEEQIRELGIGPLFRTEYAEICSKCGATRKFDTSD